MLKIIFFYHLTILIYLINQTGYTAANTVTLYPQVLLLSLGLIYHKILSLNKSITCRNGTHLM